MPLLLGALLIPLGLAFLTNLIQLIQLLTQGQNGIPVGVVAPINGTGRRRRRAAAVDAKNATNPVLYEKIMDFGALFEKGIEKWLMEDDKYDKYDKHDKHDKPDKPDKHDKHDKE